MLSNRQSEKVLGRELSFASQRGVLSTWNQSKEGMLVFVSALRTAMPPAHPAREMEASEPFCVTMVHSHLRAQPALEKKDL